MSGNVDLSAKICAVKAKHCLILLCIDHVLAFLLATGGVVYVYMSGGIFMDESYLMNLIPPVLALFSGIGAICCLFLKKRLLMAICVAWPVILCLAATVFYGIMIYTVATWNPYGRIDTVNLILTMLGIIVIPLSCCCCVVLGCLGCIIKSPDGSSNGSNSGITTPTALKSKQGKSNKMNAGNTGPTNGNGMNGNNQGNGQWNGNGGMMNQNQNQNPNWNQNQNNQNPNQNQMQNQNSNNQNWNQNPNQNQMANQNGNNWNGNQVQGRPNQGNQQANNGGVNNQGMHHKNHSQHFWN